MDLINLTVLLLAVNLILYFIMMPLFKQVREKRVFGKYSLSEFTFITLTATLLVFSGICYYSNSSIVPENILLAILIVQLAGVSAGVWLRFSEGK